jgi:hypothetical protein
MSASLPKRQRQTAAACDFSELDPAQNGKRNALEVPMEAKTNLGKDASEYVTRIIEDKRRELARLKQRTLKGLCDPSEFESCTRALRQSIKELESILDPKIPTHKPKDNYVSQF